MGRLEILILFIFLFLTNAYGMKGSFILNNVEYGLTDELYPVSGLNLLPSKLKKNCHLLSCDDAKKYADKLTYKPNYVLCNEGVLNLYTKQICNLVQLNGNVVVDCGNELLSEDKSFRAFVSCSISEDTQQKPVSQTNWLSLLKEKCWKDINKDGNIESNEIKSCRKVDDKNYVCPIDLTKCYLIQNNPVCPAGTSFVPEKDLCIGNATPKCPDGFVYDKSLMKCVTPPKCPEGGLYNKQAGNCEIPVKNECPSGYAYDSQHDICVYKAYCPAGAILNPKTDMCELRATFKCPSGSSLVNGKCVAPPSCPAGWRYSVSLNKCVKSVNYSCNSGTYSIVNGKPVCEHLPQCPLGQYSSKLKACVVNPSCRQGELKNGVCVIANAYDCPAGTTYDGKERICKGIPACPKGTEYDLYHSLCVSKPENICPKGYIYDSKQGCVRSPSCPYGQWNEGLKKCVYKITCPEGTSLALPGVNNEFPTCEKRISPSCPSGYTFDDKEGKCVSARIICPAGTKYNSSTKECEATATESCPSGFVWNEDLKKCVQDPSCPPGYTWDGSRCRAPLKTNCPSGYHWDDDLGKCVSEPSCPSGGYLSNGECVATPRCVAWLYGGYYCDRSSPSYYYRCPAGYTLTYDGFDYECVAQPYCSNGGKLDKEPAGFWIETECVLPGYAYCPYPGRKTTVMGEFWNEETICVADFKCPAGTKAVYEFVGGWIGWNVKYYCATDKSAKCPEGTIYDSLHKTCVATPNCLNGGSFNSSSGKCEVSTANFCPPSYSFNPKRKTCYITKDCPSGYSWNSELKACISNGNCLIGDVLKNGRCVRKPRLECPAGTELDGSRCVAQPSCPPKTKLQNGYCVAAPKCLTGTYENGECVSNPVCPEGFIYDKESKLCKSNPSCSEGRFEASIGLCITPAEKSCPKGSSYDSLSGKCISNAVCPKGTILNGKTDKCESIPERKCPPGFSLNGDTCQLNPHCPSGSVYDDNLNECKHSVTKVCPAGYSYVEEGKVCIYKGSPCPAGTFLERKAGLCGKEPVWNCPEGTTMNIQNKSCEAQPICRIGSYSYTLHKCEKQGCPLGNYPCYPINGSYYCSDIKCFNGNYSQVEIDDTPEGLNDKKNDGVVTKQGCQGNVYIFNGNDYRCRPPGVETGFSNCCRKSSTWFGLGQCNEREKILAKLRSWGKLDGQCHYVGSYCVVKVLGSCLQKKKTYCCFHSVLARIVQEQGRKQLGISWGSPKSPNCRGFTPDEFQRIDFSKIDFSEWYSEVRKQASQGFGRFKTQSVQHLKDYFQQINQYSK